jgi:hypothetical protein
MRFAGVDRLVKIAVSNTKEKKKEKKRKNLPCAAERRPDVSSTVYLYVAPE